MRIEIFSGVSGEEEGEGEGSYLMCGPELRGTCWLVLCMCLCVLCACVCACVCVCVCARVVCVCVCVVCVW